MASFQAMPGSSFRVDCSAVQLGCQRGPSWACAPERHLARAWGPLAAALEDGVDRVVWMPAHCGREDVGAKRLGDGSLLSETDRLANAEVDELAKAAATNDRLPPSACKWVRAQWDRVTAVATWIGQATVLADAFPGPTHLDGDGRKPMLRDNEGRRGRRAALVRAGRTDSAEAARLPAQVRSRPAGDLTGCARWEALRRRVMDRQASSSATTAAAEFG